MNIKQIRVMGIFRKTSMAFVVASAILFSSCIGSFKLTTTVYDWNVNIGSKFVNELVFLLLSVTAYPVAIAIDSLIINSIEFWSGTNPMAMKDGDKQEKLVEVDGKTYRLTSEKHKMTIEELNSANKVTELVFQAEDNSWYLKKGNKMKKLMEVECNNKGEVISYHVIYPALDGFDHLQMPAQGLTALN